MMLLSCTEKEWTTSYTTARSKILDHPTVLEKLDDVYNNPQYYSGYYHRSISCNMVFRGSIPAEQNHSFIIAFLGKNASYTITEQIVKFLERAEVQYNATCRDKDLNVQCQKTRISV